MAKRPAPIWIVTLVTLASGVANRYPVYSSQGITRSRLPNSDE